MLTANFCSSTSPICLKVTDEPQNDAAYTFALELAIVGFSIAMLMSTAVQQAKDLAQLVERAYIRTSPKFVSPGALIIIDQSTGSDAGVGNTMTAVLQEFHEAGRWKCARANAIAGQSCLSRRR
jgi:hypothetical protein